MSCVENTLTLGHSSLLRALAASQCGCVWKHRAKSLATITLFTQDTAGGLNTHISLGYTPHIFTPGRYSAHIKSFTAAQRTMNCLLPFFEFLHIIDIYFWHRGQTAICITAQFTLPALSTRPEVLIVCWLLKGQLFPTVVV